MIQIINSSYLDPRLLLNEDFNYLNDTLKYTELDGKILCNCPNNSPNNSCSLTELSIFISSLLLSLTGVVSVCLLSCRRSNCSSISLFGRCLNIERQNMDIDG